MSVPVPRTCTEISARDENQYQDKEPRFLEAFRDTPAYVLLGDPGSGKTTAFFEVECKALGEQACPITARDFLTFDPQEHPEWRDKTLFIDGLDEVRAGASDARTPFDAIRERLDALERPRFRLSCREADWLAANDRKHLEAASPDAKVTVLRLNPLTDSDIEQLLKDNPRVDDAKAFMEEANRRGIGDLLRNPQTLDLLARAVAGGDWPESRKETFEMACGQMVEEHNLEHQTASAPSNPPMPEKLLDAAGCLCTVHLIAGKAGYTLYGEPDDEYPALNRCEYAHPERLRLVSDRKLFKGVGVSDNRFAPIHRHVAEFLGARHLARIIHEGLPARRVIALMTGEDGAVVTELRGLSAWLAAHCQEARMDLIERDPIGVGLYGDIQTFSSAEKSRLLNSLKREGSRIEPHLDPQNDSSMNSMERRAAIFSALATPDMESAFKEVLATDDGSQDHQLFTDFVLRLLVQGAPLPRLADKLLEVTYDNTRFPRVREAALKAFIHNCPDCQGKVKKLKALLTDIQTGHIPDSGDRIPGILLNTLYPNEVTPSEVWSYFSKQESTETVGELWWLWKIVDNSSNEQVAEFLDDLQQRFSELQPILEIHHIGHLSLKLLARGLKAYGDQLDTARLYDWLGVGEVEDGYRINDEAAQEIRSWLEQRPEIQKDLFMEGLNRWPASGGLNLYCVYERLYHASLPSDFGLWCLKQAVAKANMEPRVAERLLEAAFWEMNRSDNKGLSLDVLREYADKDKGLKAKLEQLLASQSRIEKQRLESRERKRTFTEERLRQEEEWLAWVRSHEAALRDNRAPSHLLYQMARVYFETPYNGIDFNVDNGRDGFNEAGGPQAIAKVLRDDWVLVNAVLQGLRGTIEREDVPAVEEIISLYKKSINHYLALPFLAGLAEIERTAPKGSCRWGDDRIRKALAFYYVTLLPDNQPEWYQRLLVAHPKAVAEVQVRIAASEFRSRRKYLHNLPYLQKILEPDHHQVARHASLPLLRAFPIRCKRDHVVILIPLLWAAIQYTDSKIFLNLVERKLTRTSMNTSQRTYWLAAGLLTSPTTYKDKLEHFTQDQRQRILHLTDFLCRAPKHFLANSLKTSQLEYLIRLVGRHVNPVDILSGHFYTSTGYASGLVKSLIQNLATSPAKAASDALDSLLADPALSRWHDELSRVRDTQRIIRRDADYRHPTIEQVCQTLKGGTPANPGDLAALVMDRLGELAVQIRTGNTDDWRQYWDGLRGQSPVLGHEEDCRDALLSDLRQRLPQGVDAQPEGHYANNKRADIRVFYGGFQVPVEIKKNTHRDLWSALRNQLMAKYTSAPETDGYGIYLVFWFGKQYTQAPPSGQRPADAEELKERLEATLSSDEARKISVCVIDVCKP